MAELLSKCPCCAVIFPVSAAQLQASSGKVRCSNCQYIFQADEHAVAKRELTGKGLVSTSLEEDDLLIYDGMPSSDAQTTASTRHSEPDHTSTTPFSIPSPADLIEEPPLRPVTKKPVWHALLNGTLALTLLALLGGQYLHDNSIALAHNPSFSDLTNQFCLFTGCNTVYTDLQRIEARNFSVTSHPSADNTLLISGQLANLGQYPQHPPQLNIQFEDLNGRAVAKRLFAPDEYLPTNTTLTMIPPRQAVPFSLSVIDPGQTAQSYTLSFH